jgi:hypothetical protein
MYEDYELESVKDFSNIICLQFRNEYNYGLHCRFKAVCIMSVFKMGKKILLLELAIISIKIPTRYRDAERSSRFYESTN